MTNLYRDALATSLGSRGLEAVQRALSTWHNPCSCVVDSSTRRVAYGSSCWHAKGKSHHEHLSRSSVARGRAHAAFTIDVVGGVRRRGGLWVFGGGDPCTPPCSG